MWEPGVFRQGPRPGWAAVAWWSRWAPPRTRRHGVRQRRATHHGRCPRSRAARPGTARRQRAAAGPPNRPGARAAARETAGPPPRPPTRSPAGHWWRPAPAPTYRRRSRRSRRTSPAPAHAGLAPHPTPRPHRTTEDHHPPRSLHPAGTMTRTIRRPPPPQAGSPDGAEGYCPPVRPGGGAEARGCRAPSPFAVAKTTRHHPTSSPPDGVPRHRRTPRPWTVPKPTEPAAGSRAGAGATGRPRQPDPAHGTTGSVPATGPRAPRSHPTPRLRLAARALPEAWCRPARTTLPTSEAAPGEVESPGRAETQDWAEA